MLSKFSAVNTVIRSPATVAAFRRSLPCITTGIQRFVATAAAAQQQQQNKENVIILGAAGRDFHDFITYWSKKPNTEVKAFTGQQIPGIDQRKFPSELCNNHLNNNLYPDGIQIYPEAALENLIRQTNATTCTLAYSDLSYDTVGSLASRVNKAGCKFVLLPPEFTMVESTKPVIAVCASRTGVGKSQTTRYIANYFKNKGLKVAVIRHPMPYDKDLLSQRVQRYEHVEDMDKYHCTIEEREEYWKHILDGNLLFAGVDYPSILREAEKEADVIIWDGGNNDVPFYKPDIHITLVDSLRPVDEFHYYPGETNVRMADTILITKVNQLPSLQNAEDHAEHLESYVKPHTPIFFGKSVVSPEAKDPVTGEILSTEETNRLVKDKKVLVIDDGPTLTHGGMSYGAGYVCAENMGASEIVDPRPYAQGSLKQTFDKFPHLTKVLPAMGYDSEQVHDLEATIKATPCDAIVIGTPSDITHLFDVEKPFVMAKYELELASEDHEKQFKDVLDTFYTRYVTHHHEQELKDKWQEYVTRPTWKPPKHIATKH